MQQPKFTPGDKVTTTRYIPPIPKGATVTIVKFRQLEEENQVEYLVEGKRKESSKAVEIWVAETDLRIPWVW